MKNSWPYLFLILLIFFDVNETLGGDMKEQEFIRLPLPDTKGGMPLGAAISMRRSVRSYSDKPLSMEQISQLLWAAQGVTDAGAELRAAPSAGALYPMEVYIAKEDGLFRYITNGHKLIKISDKDPRPFLQSAALFQAPVGKATVDIIICAVYGRVTSKYGERGIRYVDIEAGHVAQNIHLQAVSLGLVSVPIGAFDDGAVRRVLKLPEEESPIYIIPVGYKKGE
jgi:SagB-type dehydrogenase family enzyme